MNGAGARQKVQKDLERKIEFRLIPVNSGQFRPIPVDGVGSRRRAKTRPEREKDTPERGKRLMLKSSFLSRRFSFLFWAILALLPSTVAVFCQRALARATKLSLLASTDFRLSPSTSTKLYWLVLALPPPPPNPQNFPCGSCSFPRSPLPSLGAGPPTVSSRERSSSRDD